MPDTVFKTQQGGIFSASGDNVGDADHVIRRHYTGHVLASTIGAAASAGLIDVPQAAIRVTGFFLVSSKNIATDANNPLIHLAKGDLANGALTNITSTAIDTDTAFNARTKMSGVISTTLATRQVAKGTGLYWSVATQGTPADITETAMFTFVVEYELEN